MEDIELEGLMVWHGYHSILMIHCIRSIQERRDEIREYKPEDEQEARLHFLKRVRGILPEEFVIACRNYLKEASERYVLWDIMKANYDKYLPEIEALHAEECKHCVWDDDKKEMIWENYKPESEE